MSEEVIFQYVDGDGDRLEVVKDSGFIYIQTDRNGVDLWTEKAVELAEAILKAVYGDVPDWKHTAELLREKYKEVTFQLRLERERVEALENKLVDVRRQILGELRDRFLRWVELGE